MGENLLRQLRALQTRCDTQLRKLITRAVGAGSTAQEIAEAVGVSRATLWRRYRTQLQRPSAQRREDGAQPSTGARRQP